MLDDSPGPKVWLVVECSFPQTHDKYETLETGSCQAAVCREPRLTSRVRLAMPLTTVARPFESRRRRKGAFAMMTCVTLAKAPLLDQETSALVHCKV